MTKYIGLMSLIFFILLIFAKSKNFKRLKLISAFASFVLLILLLIFLTNWKHSTYYEYIILHFMVLFCYVGYTGIFMAFLRTQILLISIKMSLKEF